MSGKETFSEVANTFSKSGRLYHSKRNPEKEAQLQLEQFQNSLPTYTKLVMLAINPGLHFIRQEAEKFFSKVYCLYTPEWGYELLKKPQEDDLLFPSVKALIAWFKQLNPSFLLYKPAIFYHPRFIQFDSESTKTLEIGIHQVFTEKKQELLTRGFFSYKYKKNLQRALKKRFLRSKVEPDPKNSVHNLINKPILLLVSGPSLNQYEQFLIHRSHEFYTMALSSTLAFLDKNQIQPDSVISTDPGYWAGLHLRFLSNFPHPSQINLFLSLTAETISLRDYKPSNLVANEIFFSQSTMIEQFITSRNPFGSRLLEIPEAATVSASAVEFLVRYTQQPIIILGLDLGESEGLSHVHPHPFDPFFQRNTQRTNTFETQHWKKISQNQSSLGYYHQWYVDNLEKWGSRVFLGSHNRFKIESHMVNLDQWIMSTQSQRSVSLTQLHRNAHDSFPRKDELVTMARVFSKDPFLGIHSPAYQHFVDLLSQLNYFELKKFFDTWPKEHSEDIPLSIIQNCFQEFEPLISGL